MSENEALNSKFYMVYLKALIRGILLSIAMLLLGAVVFYFSDLPEEYMKTYIWIMTVISMCYSSIYGSMKMGKKGYMHGSIIGLLYTVFLSIVAVLAEKGQINIRSYIIMAILSLIVGALSGMIGMIINKD